MAQSLLLFATINCDKQVSLELNSRSTFVANLSAHRLQWVNQPPSHYTQPSVTWTVLKTISWLRWSRPWKLLGIKWYHHVRNDEVRWTTGQPRLSAVVQARRLSLFGHTARKPDETDARSIITASPSEDWRRPPGRPRTTWMKTIQQDLRSNNLSLDEAITVAQNRPLWRLMSAFGAMHP